MGDGEGESEMCITTDYKKCGATDQVCVGKQETNFVYSLETEAKRYFNMNIDGLRQRFVCVSFENYLRL